MKYFFMELNNIFFRNYNEKKEWCNKFTSLKWLITAWLFAIISLWTPAIAQSQEDQTKKTKDELCECYYDNNSKWTIVKNKINLPTEIPNHDTLMATNVFDLSKIYWEKYVDTINKHMLIELNKFREENWKLPLQLDPKLQKVSQDFADYLFNTNKEHPDHWTWEQDLCVRLLNIGINCDDSLDRWENLCAWIEIPQEAFCKLIGSKDHRALFLADDVVYYWLGLAISNVNDNDERHYWIKKGTEQYERSGKKLYSTWIFTLTWDYKKKQECKKL